MFPNTQSSITHQGTKKEKVNIKEEAGHGGSHL